MPAERAAINEVSINGTQIRGIRDAKFVTKRTQKEIVVDDYEAPRRMGLLRDADLNLTILYDPADIGQQALLAADRANSLAEFTVVKGSIIYVVIGGIGQIGVPNDDANENILEVQIAISETIELIYEGRE